MLRCIGRCFPRVFRSFGNITSKCDHLVHRHLSTPTSTTLQLKKRPVRKQRTASAEDAFCISAFATADEYDLEALIHGLRAGGVYEPRTIDNHTDCVHAVVKEHISSEPREVFFFREGSLVMWNVDEVEMKQLRRFVACYETDAYATSMVVAEGEHMVYGHRGDALSTTLDDSGRILLAPARHQLDKYTLSNAIATSVKLGVWEASLERYIDSIAFVTDDLKLGRRVRMSREQVLRKHGELFALRHVINLSSDLLDVPDFYWEREHLEQLYRHGCAYFSIAKRTRVMNEKINHCVELIELLASHLSDKHHIRLEWMIIALIMVEVGFEVIHYLDKYV